MIEEPFYSLQGNFSVDLFEHVQHPADAFVIGGVKPERPSICGQQRDNLFEFLLHIGQEVGAGLEKIFKIRRRIDQHFSSAVAAVKIVTPARSG